MLYERQSYVLQYSHSKHKVQFDTFEEALEYKIYAAKFQVDLDFIIE